MKSSSQRSIGLPLKSYIPTQPPVAPDRAQGRASPAVSGSSSGPSFASANDSPAGNGAAARPSPRAAPPTVGTRRASQPQPSPTPSGGGGTPGSGNGRTPGAGLQPSESAEDEGPIVVPDHVDEDLADKSDYVKAKVMARRNELKRVQEERIAEAAARDAAQAAEQAAKDAAKAMHGARLSEWALEPSGQPKNIRVLISTLHTVLWPDAKWEPVAMAKLIAPAKVKFYFMRAITVVHPDKQNTMDGTQKFIATQVFHNMEQAYRQFQETEMGQ